MRLLVGVYDRGCNLPSGGYITDIYHVDYSQIYIPSCLFLYSPIAPRTTFFYKYLCKLPIANPTTRAFSQPIPQERCTAQQPLELTSLIPPSVPSSTRAFITLTYSSSNRFHHRPFQTQTGPTRARATPHSTSTATHRYCRRQPLFHMRLILFRRIAAREREWGHASRFRQGIVEALSGG